MTDTLVSIVERVVGVSQLLVSADPNDVLVTYALGSCLGVAVYDPVALVGGLLHVQLPTGTLDPARMLASPAAFVDSGVPLLFRECYRLGARKERMHVRVAGGAQSDVLDGDGSFQVGKRNVLALRRLLWKNGVLVHAQDTGGIGISRTMRMSIATGAVTLRVDGIDSPL